MEQKTILHSPRLNTMLMVEKTLKEAELVISKNELLRRLPKKVMRQTLNTILNYMEEKGLIIIGQKGVLWTHNDNQKLQTAINRGTEI